MATTTNFGWTYPTVGGDTDTWGTILNNVIIAVDAEMFALSPASAGTLNNYVIGGITPLAGSFTTITGVDITATGNVSMSGGNKTVTMSPTGTGTVTIAPATAGSINNMTIGASTPLAGNFTTLGASGNASAGNVSTATVTATTQVLVPNTGLKLADTNASHYLTIAPGSDLTGNRTVTVTTGDADRTLTLSGNVTLPAGTALIAANNLSDLTNASTARTNLGVPLGTSGATVPLLNGANTHSGTAVFSNSVSLNAQNTFGTTASVLINAILSPTQITSNQNNYAPTGWQTCMIMRVNSDAARDITGIDVTGISLMAMYLVNTGAFTITLKHDVTSTAANRFSMPGSADFALTANSAILIWYDPSTARWRKLA